MTKKKYFHEVIEEEEKTPSEELQDELEPIDDD